ncbi:E3 ubiquitin/ISG15 ligase TRIM25-like isoform X2 [Labeo rohita]|nr:E3 ubiquitin/ISG15 ligase TRIM25-like isoform X2 [Labeo rohita]XP_050981422.1 E3 ubiquitin/ISG15 ligase TRIM25-like isoform X2 [Labeo rohita]XP_050981423.1 E3 ubiquitin/ISG15 ligase TRIM25-like isoform X2 [Labeo rohita]XP_050981424.1 E3 ubiquitin/ISG15 ligase TRIM25-like isoform X2 [Labeo rohita]
MAESSDDQNLFNCPICLHLLNDPVTTTCGHSFCMNCLNEFWDRDNQKGNYSCPQCRQTFSPRPTLSRNTVLAEVVERMKKEAPEAGTASPVPSFAVSGDMECDICTETKLKAIKSCLTCLASYCESHIQTHYTSPALKWHKLVSASPHLLDQICSQHRKILELYCCKDQQLICMQCALINHQNHRITSPAAERQKIQVQLKENQDGLQKEMRQRELKVQELRQAVDSHKCSAKAAVVHSEQMFTELISSMKKRRAEITKMIRAQEKAEVSRVEEVILALEQEISDLRKRHDKLGQLALVEDDIYVIQKFSSFPHYQCSDLCNTSVSQQLTFEEIEKVVSELKSQLDDLCEQDVVRILEKVPTVHVMVNSVNNKMLKKYLPSQPKTREEFLMYSIDLNLNASGYSALSVKNSKSVVMCNNSYLTNEHNFQVLCKEKLSGRCYFEVQWEGAGCCIAFSYDSITSSVFGSNKISWKCGFPKSNISMWHNWRQTDISLVSKIGVFLDQEAGTVSFYSVSDKMTLLHRIQTTFTAPLYPGFSLYKLGNDSSLTICDLP